MNTAARLALALPLVFAACGSEGPSGGADGGASSADATPGGGNPDAAPVQVDCNSIPQGPFNLRALTGPIASEDLAFDGEGNVVGSDDQTIYKSAYNGAPQVFVPSFNFRAGLRYSSDGDLLVNDDTTGSLVRVDAQGVKHTVLSGLAYPNGMTADRKGYVYVTEQAAGRVRRIHPTTGEFQVISEGEISEPNGLTFNEDYTALYIAGFSGEGTVYELPMDANGNPGTIRTFATGIGTGYLDGMAVDACGNVYIADFGASHIYRIAPDGGERRVIIDGGFTYLPNMQWGSGIGGWDADKLYLPDGDTHTVYEVDLGVPSKRRAYP
jgi:streptogramin lyase